MTPELRLECRCGTVGTWIIPRPEMLDMVREIAAHAGWREEPCRCPECGRAAAPELYARGRRLSWRAPLMAYVHELRERGLMWHEVGNRISGQVGFPVHGKRASDGFFKALAAQRRAA
jgi:hypothetical protein